MAESTGQENAEFTVVDRPALRRGTWLSEDLYKAIEKTLKNGAAVRFARNGRTVMNLGSTLRKLTWPDQVKVNVRADGTDYVLVWLTRKDTAA